jgi:GGDEF domain-containing protein
LSSNPINRDARRLDADAASNLERFASSPALASGQVNLLSLDAIAERLGSRWTAKRDSVYEYIERTLERHVGNRGYFLRVSETDFLVALPDEQKFAAQMRCLRYLREVLMHFFGEAPAADVTVREVTRITADGLEARLVDPVEAARAADEEKAREIEVEGPAGPVDRWTPFVASNGRKVRVSCMLEPVLELKNYGRIGNRIARRVLRVDTDEPLTVAEIQNLSRSDIEKIDFATIARGLHRLRTETDEDHPLTLIIPVSFVSLSSRQGRAALASLFEEAKALVRAGVICEVCDIEGVPQAALLAATSLIKPYCLFLVGRLAAAPDHGLDNLRGAGLQAVSFEVSQTMVGDAEFLRWAKKAIGAAKRIAKSVMIYRLGSPRHAGMAALLGASHASMRPTVTVAA